MKKMKKEEQSTTKKRITTKNNAARDRIKPRGLFGIMKGKIHYDENADIFNLGL